MFKYIEDVSQAVSVSVTIDGREVRALEGATVAMVMLQSGISRFRSSAVSGEPRAPLCLMGVCFECLVTIDGHKHVQSCLVPVAAGMDIRTDRVGDISGD
jgi:predicted molibdopterin-dependent oxidoreductase YjgC